MSLMHPVITVFPALPGRLKVKRLVVSNCSTRNLTADTTRSYGFWVAEHPAEFRMASNAILGSATKRYLTFMKRSTRASSHMRAVRVDMNFNDHHYRCRFEILRVGERGHWAESIGSPVSDARFVPCRIDSDNLATRLRICHAVYDVASPLVQAVCHCREILE